MRLDLVQYFLSIASLSVVLLGICTTIKNAAFSSLISQDASEITVKDHNYEDILRNSGRKSMWAGAVFTATTVMALSGLGSLTFNRTMVAKVLAWSSTGVFLVGVALLAISLLWGHFSPPSFNSPEPPETETMNSSEDAIDTEDRTE